MSSDRDAKMPERDRITLDQIRHRVDEVHEIAVSDAKSVASAVVRNEGARALFLVAGVVVVAASLAYFIGARSCRMREIDL